MNDQTGCYIEFSKTTLPRHPIPCSPEPPLRATTFSGRRFRDNKKTRLLEVGFLAPPAGLEPATNRLTAGCSTTELQRNVLMKRSIATRSSSVYPLRKNHGRINCFGFSLHVVFQQMIEIEVQFFPLFPLQFAFSRTLQKAWE